jgi:hypothetical protein
MGSLSSLIRDSLEGLVWTVPSGGEGAPVEGRGARRDNRLFLDGRAGVCYCFSELSGKAGSPFHGGRDGVAIRAKRKGGQAIENKQLREMVHFAPPTISMAYDTARETVHFARRMNPFAFAGFSASSRAKTQESEIDADSGLARRTLRESATRNWRREPLESVETDSEIAPPAPTAGRKNRPSELRITEKHYQIDATRPVTSLVVITLTS